MYQDEYLVWTNHIFILWCWNNWDENVVNIQKVISKLKTVDWSQETN